MNSPQASSSLSEKVTFHDLRSAQPHAELGERRTALTQPPRSQCVSWTLSEKVARVDALGSMTLEVSISSTIFSLLVPLHSILFHWLIFGKAV